MSPPILEEWAAANPRSREQFQRASQSLPSGITHDIRHAAPFPLLVRKAGGSHKQDVDGHDLICYVMGHGALLLGHNPPQVVEAIRANADRLLHGGASHELEAEWAERICRLVPAAERVCFTSSGTEATMLGLQVARAHTGRDVVLKFEGHFHGWHDTAKIGADLPVASAPPAGVPAALLEVTRVVRPELTEVEAALSDRQVAAVILEPSGAGWGALPLSHDFLAGLRRLTSATRTLLMFDEVVTGFRWSTGGVQQEAAVTPDLTTLAKIVAGGMPGGVLAGSAEVMDVLSFRPDGAVKVSHPGTHNGHPLSAAAGIAMLDAIAGGSQQSRADELAEWLRSELAGAFDRAGVSGFVYGESSTFRVMPGERPPGQPSEWALGPRAAELKNGPSAELASALQAAMLLEGVHIFHGNAGLLSSAHNEADIEQTATAFEKSLRRLRDEGLLPSD